MAFEKVPGLKGKVYVPDEPKEGLQKHTCQDCYSCQHCSDDRCRLCLDQKFGHCRNHKN